MFFTGSFDGMVKVWDTNTLKTVLPFSLGDRVYSIALSPVAVKHTLIAGTSSLPLLSPSLSPHLNSFCSIAFFAYFSFSSPALSLTLCHYLSFCAPVGSSDPKIRLCDVRTNNSTHLLAGHREAVWCVRWFPNNEFLLASASQDWTIRIW